MKNDRRDPPATTEATAALPEEFLNRLQRIVGPDRLEAVIHSFCGPKRTSFRVNTLLGDPAAVRAALRDQGVAGEPVDWCDHAFSVDAPHRETLTRSPLASSGEIYIQGLSSILATLVLDPQPEEWVLDLAAAPGGKSTHIAALMQNRGKLSVVEPVKKRMYRLADNLKRAGVSISKTYLMDGRKVGQKVPSRFDRILLDAPCSGEARIRTENPESFRFWGQRKIREQSRKQAGLLRSAFVALKPGGTLLYGTCSFAPEENEQIVAGLLHEVGDGAEVLPVDLPIKNWQPGLTGFADRTFPESLSLTRRILPDESFDGFYLAKLAKRA